MYRFLVNMEAKHCPDNRDNIWHNIEMAHEWRILLVFEGNLLIVSSPYSKTDAISLKVFIVAPGTIVQKLKNKWTWSCVNK